MAPPAATVCAPNLSIFRLNMPSEIRRTFDMCSMWSLECISHLQITCVQTFAMPIQDGHGRMRWIVNAIFCLIEADQASIRTIIWLRMFFLLFFPFGPIGGGRVFVLNEFHWKPLPKGFRRICKLCCVCIVQCNMHSKQTFAVNFIFDARANCKNQG